MCRQQSKRNPWMSKSKQLDTAKLFGKAEGSDRPSRHENVLSSLEVDDVSANTHRLRAQTR